ncbi:MAG: hypothetical protein R8M71_02510 [Alphaproteobacteria bacterium]|nr:hypothetical protein [Alphaproteobacteria bacterium]
MKKTLKAAVALSVFAAPAYAANLENPLYMPTQGSVYSKTSAGVMYKIADDTAAMKAKNHDGATEFPIWRLHEELGYGILDNLEAYAKFGYTHDGDIDRKGMHLGRAGLKYRALEMSGYVWDLYADAQLGGISEMSGAYTATGFDYDNYSNGRWGFHVGTQFGKQFEKFSVAAFAEVLRTFGNDNNSIDVTGFSIDLSKFGASGIIPATALGFADEISVDLKSTTEVNAGLKAFYQMDDKWSFGASFTYKHHADNGVEGLATDLGAINTGNPTMDAGLTMAGAQDKAVAYLMSIVEDMNDGFDEYVIGLSAAYQMTETTQVAVYGEYTLDTAHDQSQNGTDVKAELGVRLNVQF